MNKITDPKKPRFKAGDKVCYFIHPDSLTKKEIILPKDIEISKFGKTFIYVNHSQCVAWLEAEFELVNKSE